MPSKRRRLELVLNEDECYITALQPVITSLERLQQNSKTLSTALFIITNSIQRRALCNINRLPYELGADLYRK